MFNNTQSKTKTLEAPPPPIYIFREHKSLVNHLHLFGKDQYLVSSDNDGWIVIWNMKTKRSITKWRAHKEPCLQAVTIENHTKLISQGRDNLIHIWKLTIPSSQEQGSQEQQRKDGPPELITSITYNGVAFCKLSCYESKDSVLLCFPSEGGLAMFDIYDLTNRRYILQSVADDSGTLRPGTCMALHIFKPSDVTMDSNAIDKPEQQERPPTIHVLAGYESGIVALWELSATRYSERRKILWHKREHKEPILGLALDPTYTFAISSSADNQLYKYYLSTGKIQQTTLKKSGVATLKIRDDNKIFATGGHDNRIRIFSVKTMKPLAILSYHKDSIYSLEFGHENHSLLIGGSEDSRISLWNIY